MMIEYFRPLFITMDDGEIVVLIQRKQGNRESKLIELRSYWALAVEGT
jgi:hypothetical protein